MCWQSCLHVRRCGFSACRSELPYVCLRIPCSCFVNKYIKHVLGGVQAFVLVFKTPLRFAAGSFAGASGALLLQVMNWRKMLQIAC